MIRLTKKQILILHSHLIRACGGSDGIRDEKLLESALESPFSAMADRAPEIRMY